MFELRKLYKDESGIAALIVTTILVIVIGLIVLGFAFNARQEQSRTLDNQLNAEAYYAAESGVNDAYAVISKDMASGGNVISQTRNCSTDDNGGHTYSSNQSISTNGVVGYTCLLVNPAPPTLLYSPIRTGQGQTIPIFGEDSSGGPTPISSISLSWDGFGVGSNFGGCPSSSSPPYLPSYSTWQSMGCDAPVLQVDIIPVDGWTDTASLISYSSTIYLVPSQFGSGSVNVNNGPVSGQVVLGHCTTSPVSPYAYSCYEVLNDLPCKPGNSCNTSTIHGIYYIHVTPIYYDADLSVSTNAARLANAQAFIDSTAKADNDLKRIQERISINPVGSNNLPTNGLQSANSICKAFTTRPGFSSGPGIPGSSC